MTKKKCKKYDGVREPSFSPDGEKVAYSAKEGDKWLMVVVDKSWFTVIDEKEGEKYDDVSIPCFSPDSKRFGYWAMEGIFFLPLSTVKRVKDSVILVSPTSVLTVKVSLMA